MDPQAVPEWRREVSEKARAYGEKKKLLTTPPRPLKENSEEMESPEPDTSEPLNLPELTVTPASPRESEMILQTPEPEPSVDLAPRVLLKDWKDPIELKPLESTPHGRPLFLARRTGSFLIDNTILIVLNVMLLYVCSLVIPYDPWTLVQTAWLPLVGAFLLFHLLYYSYFYKTARQTPGQVFFKLELRDPSSSYIPFGKILVRWMSMVFLNIFNFIPLAMKDGHLLLDQLSNTEIRSLQ
jgi:uncharacterized RDD family membrane protein YckC